MHIGTGRLLTDRRRLLAGLSATAAGLHAAPVSARDLPNPAGRNDAAPVPGYVFFGLETSNDNIDSLILAIDYLKSFDPSDLLLIIQSSGGNVSSAGKFYNYARNWNISFDTLNLSSVESAANMVYLAGKRRYAADSAYFMLHSITNNGVGPNATIRSYSDQQASLNRSEGLMRSALRDRTRFSNDDIDRFFREQIFVDAAQARRMQMVTEAGTPVLDHNALKVVVTGGDQRYRPMFSAAAA